ncbi:MAG: D-alanine--D-alanine ligase family protein [Myxococcota bacterium]
MKKNLLLVFGGRSGEHEVSLKSARNVYNAIDRKEFDIFLMGIEKDGTFKYFGKNIEGVDDFKEFFKYGVNCTLTFDGRGSHLLILKGKKFVYVDKIDVAFPVLHGTFGEDGTIQGLFEMANIPYVGGGVLASSVCMDKEICKRILRDNGIKIVPFYILKREMPDKEKKGIVNKAIREFGFPLFTKPANLGSSVGISKAKSRLQLEDAIRLAFKYDTKVIIEMFIKGREIECAVMGNQEAKAAVPGEVIPVNEFYDYEAKYIKEGSKTEVPARLSKSISEEIKRVAIRAYQVCNLEGMARVDFFLTDNEIFVNEINTIPGFTKISMFPMMWKAEGLSYKMLVKRLINLALLRDRIKRSLIRSI